MISLSAGLARIEVGKAEAKSDKPEQRDKAD
jgi:hypothetical protein